MGKGTTKMMCPKCGSKNLESTVIYYDAMISSLEDYIRYTCKDCKMEFKV